MYGRLIIFPELMIDGCHYHFIKVIPVFISIINKDYGLKIKIRYAVKTYVP